MMRYDFHVHKDYHGIKAEDKEKEGAGHPVENCQPRGHTEGFGDATRQPYGHTPAQGGGKADERGFGVKAMGRGHGRPRNEAVQAWALCLLLSGKVLWCKG